MRSEESFSFRLEALIESRVMVAVSDLRRRAMIHSSFIFFTISAGLTMVKVCRSVGTQVVFLVCLIVQIQSFLAPTPIPKSLSPSLSPCLTLTSTNIPLIPTFQASRVASFASAKILATMSMSTSATATTLPSWADLQDSVGSTPVGRALTNEVELRKTGAGSAHVHSTLRTFGSKEEPQITFYRDHAAVCKYRRVQCMLHVNLAFTWLAF
jgi:hypothetical protein